MAIPNQPVGSQFPGRPKVFILHGRDSQAQKALGDFVTVLGAEVINYSRAINPAATDTHVMEMVERRIDSADAVIVLFTPDEYIALQPRFRVPTENPANVLRWAPRPNVLLEAGLAWARAKKKTILVRLGPAGLRFADISDLAGFHYRDLTTDQGTSGLVQLLKSLIPTLDDSIDAVDRAREKLANLTFQRGPVVQDPFRPWLLLVVSLVALLGGGGIGVAAQRMADQRDAGKALGAELRAVDAGSTVADAHVPEAAPTVAALVPPTDAMADRANEPPPPKIDHDKRCDKGCERHVTGQCCEPDAVHIYAQACGETPPTK